MTGEEGVLNTCPTEKNTNYKLNNNNNELNSINR